LVGRRSLPSAFQQLDECQMVGNETTKTERDRATGSKTASNRNGDGQQREGRSSEDSASNPTPRPSRPDLQNSDDDLLADENRWVARRAELLKHRDGLKAAVAETVAWHELGYSSSGVAKRVNVTAATVRSYLDDVEEQYGREAASCRRRDRLAIDAPLVGSGGDNQ
jgi:hypothetical protein